MKTVTEKTKSPLEQNIFKTLNFPTRVDFAKIPVKTKIKKPILLQNTSKTQTFKLKFDIPSGNYPFRVKPDEAELPPMSSLQIVLQFKPNHVQKFKSDWIVATNSGESFRIPLIGEGYNENISLSANLVEFPDTFVTQTSQKAVKIVNNSGVKVEYFWKKFATVEEETLSINKELNDFTLTKTAAMDESEAKQKERDLASFDNLKFQDDLFTIQPEHGVVWPNSEAFVTIDFHPLMEEHFQRLAFCDIDGFDLRLPLKLSGKALGPRVEPNFKEVDIGKVFVNSTNVYKISLQNSGFVPAPFKVFPLQSLYGSKFSFSPESGAIPPQKSEVIQITFNCDLIGPFSEVFKWEIHGASNPVTCKFLGQVIGPTFKFDKPRIDFGEVSFNFLNSQTITLTNTSKIPMKFNLRIPEDGELLKREFDVVPATGIVLPESNKTIKIEFLSNTVKEYRYNLIMDVGEVGLNLHSIPIRAICKVPFIAVSNQKLTFSDVFLGVQYSRDFELLNSSSLASKFEIILPSENEPVNPETPGSSSTINLTNVPNTPSANNPNAANNNPNNSTIPSTVNSARGLNTSSNTTSGKVTAFVDQPTGIVAANSSNKIRLTIETKKRGLIFFQFFVKILGSTNPPIECSAQANSLAATVNLKNNKVDFGQIPVLKEQVQYITLENTSPIDAPFKLALQDGSIFYLKENTGVVPANSSFDAPVYVLFDDAVKAQDVLLIDFEQSKQQTCEISGTGKGNVLIPSLAELENGAYNFGNRFSQQKFSQTFTIQNKGRKPKAIAWVSALKAGKKKPDDNTVCVFNILPETCTIQAKTEQSFTIEGFSEKEGDVSEVFTCKSVSAKNKNQQKPLFETKIKAKFHIPSLKVSKTKMDYQYSFHELRQPSTQTQTLILKNISPLPFCAYFESTKKNVFSFTTNAIPSNVPNAAEPELSPKSRLLATDYLDEVESTISGDSNNLASGNQNKNSDVLYYRIDPEQTMQLEIHFHPSKIENQVTQEIKSKLNINYQYHPHKVSIDLVGLINYPELKLDKNLIDFGVVPKETEKKKTLILKNDSAIDASFSWEFETQAATLLANQRQNLSSPQVSIFSPTPDNKSTAMDYKPNDKFPIDANINQNPEKNDKAEKNIEKQNALLKEATSNSAASAVANSNDSPQYFEILPSKGKLRAGESQTIEVIFKGLSFLSGNSKSFTAKSILQVKGGIDQELKMKAEVGIINFKIEEEMIEFGTLPFTNKLQKELTLKNTGKVPFKFSVKAPQENSPTIVELNPDQGMLKNGQTQKILVSITPNLVADIENTLKIQIADLPPYYVKYHTKGISFLEVNPDRETLLKKFSETYVMYQRHNCFDEKEKEQLIEKAIKQMKKYFYNTQTLPPNMQTKIDSSLEKLKQRKLKEAAAIYDSLEKSKVLANLNWSKGYSILATKIIIPDLSVAPVLDFYEFGRVLLPADVTNSATFVIPAGTSKDEQKKIQKTLADKEIKEKPFLKPNTLSFVLKNTQTVPCPWSVSFENVKIKFRTSVQLPAGGSPGTPTPGAQSTEPPKLKTVLSMRKVLSPSNMRSQLKSPTSSGNLFKNALLKSQGGFQAASDASLAKTFTIDKQNGVLAPNSEETLTVSFTPDDAIEYVVQMCVQIFDCKQHLVIFHGFGATKEFIDTYEMVDDATIQKRLKDREATIQKAIKDKEAADARAAAAAAKAAEAAAKAAAAAAKKK